MAEMTLAARLVPRLSAQARLCARTGPDGDFPMSPMGPYHYHLFSEHLLNPACADARCPSCLTTLVGK